MGAISGSHPSELWLPIKGYEGLYSVSDRGRVRSDRKDQIMSPVLDGHGYPTVRLSRDGEGTRYFVHRLVADAFHADKRNILHKEVAHLDGSRTNNAASNLKWVSRAENCSHKRLHGTHQAGEAHPRAKLTADDVRAILASPESNCALARKYGVQDAAISKIRKGQRWADQAPAGLGASRFDPERIEMPGADVLFFRRPEFSADLGHAFDELRVSIPWKAREIYVAGRCIVQPRLTSWHADEGVSYTYSGRTHHPRPWTETLLGLKRDVERIAGAAFNSVLLNLYPDARASIGFHSDDEPELGDRPVIASLSLGADREFRFRPKHGCGKLTKVVLTHGSVLVMRGDTQRNWMHGIEKSREPCGERINLTFRLTHAIAAKR